MTRLLPSSLARVAVSSLIAAVAPLSGCLDQPFATNVDLPLQVIQLAPTDGQAGVARDAAITATFNLPVVEASLADNVVVENVAVADAPVAIEGAIAYEKPDGDAAPRMVFTPAALLPYSTPIRVTLATGIERDTEPKGNLLQPAVSVFTTIDPPPLSVVDISPDPGATGVDPATSIRITFSEPVRCASAEAGITVTETFDAHPHRGALAGTTAPVAGTFTCTEPTSIEETGCTNDACVVTFAPAAPFLLSSNVTISIKGGTRADGAVESFRSTAVGGQLPATVTGSFFVLDPPALLLTSSTPGDGATNVGLDATVTLSFSEDLDCATVTDALAVTETLADGSNAPLGIASAACTGGTVVISFDRALSYSATVDVTVAATVESARATTRGGQLVGGAAISFTTLDPPPLLVLSTTPGEGSTQVGLDADIVIEFSEALDCGSVTPAAFTVVETFDAIVATRLGNVSVTHPVSVTCDGSRVDVVVPRYQHTSAVEVAVAGSVRSARATLLGGQLNDGAGHAFGFSTEDPLDLFLANASPANGSTGIPVGTSLTLEFSEAIDCATVDALDVVVTEAFAQQFLDQAPPNSPATATRAVTVTSCTGTSLVLDPVVDFELASRVTVALPGAIASARATTARGRLNGGAGLSYSFVIIPFPPVEVLSVFPDGGSLIARAPTFRVTFNQSIFDPIVALRGDRTETQVFLAETDDTDAPPDIARAVALACQNCQTGATFTFAPTAPLVDGQRYALVIRGGAAGVRGAVGGSVMLADVVERYLVVGGGLFVGSDPANGDTGVPVTDKVCATFLVDFAELSPAAVVTDQGQLDFLEAAFALTATTPLGTQSPIPVNYSVDGVDPVSGIAGQGGTTTNRVCLTPLPATHPCSEVDELLPDDSDITLSIRVIDNRDPEVGAIPVNRDITFRTGGLPSLTDSFYETIPAINLVGELTTEVPVNGTLALVFETPLDAATALDNVHLTAAGVPIAASVTIDENEVRIDPTANLAFNTVHNIVVDGGVSGVRFTDGRYLGEDETLSFTTSPPNAAGITVLDSENASEVTVSPIVFERAMFLPSITGATILARDNTTSSAVEGGVATFVNDPFSAVFTAQPSYLRQNSVTLTVTTGALDFLGNPLPAPVAVTWDSIGSTSAAAANPPDLLDATRVSPNTGAVAATQGFRVTIPPSANSKLANRMVPSSFNDTSILFEQTAACALGGAAHSIDTTHRFNIATVTQGSETIDLTPGERLRSGCSYRLTLRQRFFANIYLQQVSATAPDVVINVTGETTRPAVTSNNVTNARGGQAFTTTFDEPIDLATISALSVTDTSPGGTAVAGTWSTSGNDAVFTPSSFWRTGRTYSVTFPTTVADLAGNQLQTATTRTLVTETTAPVAPVAATTTDGALVLTFDEALDPASVRPTTFGAIAAAGTIRVTTTGGADVAACVHAEGRVVTIDHIDAPADTALQIVVTTGVTDEAGNAIASNSTISATRP
jgi:hypothetical protein